MLRVFADHTDFTFAPNNLAFRANAPDRRSYFHVAYSYETRQGLRNLSGFLNYFVFSIAAVTASETASTGWVPSINVIIWRAW